MQDITLNKVVLFPINSVRSKTFNIYAWDVSKVCELTDLKEYSYFYFITQEKHIEYKDDDNAEILSVKVDTIDQSSNYFIDAYTETKEDVEAKRDTRLLNIMEGLKWDKVVRGVNNNWTFQFKEGDCIVDLNGSII